MNRIQKLKMNTITSLLNRFVRLVSGLILPRFILLYYGSEVNGLVASINQFLSIITFLDLGVGAVIQAALYEPLATKDTDEISNILAAANQYFRRIAYVLVVYVIGLMIFYPLLINPSLDFLSTSFLIFGLSISLFGQYYFGIVNELLLNADQKSYVQTLSEIVVVILNLVASLLLISSGYSIQVVKLVAGLIYLIRPVFLSYYVNKHYDIDYQKEIEGDPLPQKWNGMGHHIAYTIQNSSDTVLITLFSTLENVSIYSVYNMVVGAVKMLLSSFTGGLDSFFGNLLANKEIKLLNNYFSKVEWILHTGVTFLFGMTIVLINPFVEVYTSGVNDISYYAPVFSLFLVLANFVYCIRIPYRTLIYSAGHFKQTQKQSYIEAGINVFISVALIGQIELAGVAIGTLISVSYHTLYLVVYLSRNIVYRPLTYFIKHISVDALTFLIMFFIGISVINNLQITGILEWVILAIILGLTFIVIILIINYIFYREIVVSILNRIIIRNKK